MKSNIPILSKNQSFQNNPQSLPPIDWENPRAAQEAYMQLLYQVQFLWQRIGAINGFSGVVVLTTGGHTYTFTNGILTKYV